MYLWKAVVAKKKTVILNAFADIHFGYNKEESTWEGNIYYMLEKASV